MNERQMAIIKDNLHAFLANFGPVRIESYDGESFNLYYPADKPEGEYIQHCYDISYLDGFLYGCVVGVLRVRHIAGERDDEKFMEDVYKKIKREGDVYSL